MINYIADGETIDYTAGADISSGDLVVVGTLVGVAVDDIDSGDTGVVRIAGVVEVDKEASLDVSQGDALYCDATSGELDKTETAQTYAGRAYADSGTSATTVKVILNV